MRHGVLPGIGIDLASLSVDHDIRFPGESGEYRRERNRLLEAEIELRRAIERVGVQRRALPPGGPVPDGEDPRHVDSIWPIWSVLDMAPEGRGTDSDFPRLHYE